MKTGQIVDILLIAVLLFGLCFGAKRGLFKSLMGLVVVAAALVGAVMLAPRLAAPVADRIAPYVENALTQKFSNSLQKAANGAAGNRDDDFYETLERMHFPTQVVQGVRDLVSRGVSSSLETTKSLFREAISQTVHSLVYNVTHAILVLVLYLVLMALFKRLVRLLDHVFDLPVLSTVNNLGGAALGLAEAAALLYAAVYLVGCFRPQELLSYAEQSRALKMFVSLVPEKLFSLLM